MYGKQSKQCKFYEFLPRPGESNQKTEIDNHHIEAIASLKNINHILAVIGNGYVLCYGRRIESNGGIKEGKKPNCLAGNGARKRISSGIMILNIKSIQCVQDQVNANE